jgi:hypothetical protein
VIFLLGAAFDLLIPIGQPVGMDRWQVLPIKNASQEWKAFHHSSLVFTGSIPVGTYTRICRSVRGVNVKVNL